MSYLSLQAGNIYLPDKLLGMDSGGVNFMTIKKKKALKYLDLMYHIRTKYSNWSFLSHYLPVKLIL